MSIRRFIVWWRLGKGIENARGTSVQWDRPRGPVRYRVILFFQSSSRHRGTKIKRTY